MMVERISNRAAEEPSIKAKRSSHKSGSVMKDDYRRHHQSNDPTPAPHCPSSPLAAKKTRQGDAINECGKVSAGRIRPSETPAPGAPSSSSGHRSSSRSKNASNNQEDVTGSARNSHVRTARRRSSISPERSTQKSGRRSSSSHSPDGEEPRRSSHAGSKNRKPDAATDPGGRKGIPTSTLPPPSSPTPFDRSNGTQMSPKLRPHRLPPSSPPSGSPKGKPRKSASGTVSSPQPKKSTSRRRLAPEDGKASRSKSLENGATPESPLPRSSVESHRLCGKVTGPPLSSRPQCEKDDEIRPISEHDRTRQTLLALPASPTRDRTTMMPAATAVVPVTPPTVVPVSDDDLVEQEAPDYSAFYSSPRRRSSSNAGGGAPPPTPRITNGGGGAGTARQSPPDRWGAKDDSVPARIEHAYRIERPRSPVRDPTTTTGPNQQHPPSSPLSSSRVTSTRSRLQGVMGTIRWIIHIDTPGGHAEGRLRLVTGVEERDDGDNNGSTNYNDRHESNGKATEQRRAGPIRSTPVSSKLPPTAQRQTNGLDEAIYFANPDDDSSLDTANLHESVLGFMKRLEQSTMGPTAEDTNDSIIDYEHTSSKQSSLAGVPVTVPNASSTSTPQSSLHASVNSSYHVKQQQQREPSDQKPVPPQRLVSHSNMWQSNRLVEPQLHAPPPQPRLETTTASIPSGSGTSASLHHRAQQKKHKQHPCAPIPQSVPAPSNRFVPRVASNDDTAVDANDSTMRLTRENSLDAHTFADTVGDDTIYNSCDIPDMWQLEAFEKSHTWGQVDDFSISDAGKGVDDDYTDDEETLVNPFSSGCKSVDTNVMADDDEEDDDVSDYRHVTSSSLIAKYGYAGTQTSALVGKSPASRLEKREGRADEASIDPSKCFLPRGSGASALTNASDSLADIQDSFACDSGIGDFQNSLSTHKRKNLSDFSVDSSVNINQNSNSRGLTSLPEDYVLSDDGYQGNNKGVHAAPTGMRRTIGILGGGISSGVKRSSGLSTTPQPLLPSRKDSSRLSATQHQTAPKPVASRQRNQTIQSTTVDAGRYPNVSVPILASQFADSFLGPTATGRHVSQTTCSENDVDTLEHQGDPPILTPQRSVNSISTGSDSSASRRSFGIPGLRARSQDDLNPFVQLNLTAADGVKVISNNDDVDSGRAKHFTSSNRASALGGQQLYAKSDHDQSIYVFDASNEMPPLVDMAEPMRRKSPTRALSLLGNRRSGKKPAPCSTPDAQPFKTPIVSNRKFLRREKSNEGLVNKSSHHDIVKRFFTMANSSFGSLGPPAEFLDEDDGDDDCDFLY